MIAASIRVGGGKIFCASKLSMDMRLGEMAFFFRRQGNGKKHGRVSALHVPVNTCAEVSLFLKKSGGHAKGNSNTKYMVGGNGMRVCQQERKIQNREDTRVQTECSQVHA